MKFEVKGGLIAAIALSVLESASAQSLIETIDTAIANNPEIRLCADADSSTDKAMAAINPPF
ncbi:MAG: hypothetical protein AAFS03_08880, partial [Pseudomonadota bacterium]